MVGRFGRSHSARCCSRVDQPGESVTHAREFVDALLQVVNRVRAIVWGWSRRRVHLGQVQQVLDVIEGEPKLLGTLTNRTPRTASGV